MLGLLLVYFIGKKFYDLAALYKKSEILFAILGVVSYYVGAFVIGIVLAIIIGPEAIDELNDILLSLMAIPAGLLSCYLFYLFLDNSWSKSKVNTHPDILDDFDV